MSIRYETRTVVTANREDISTPLVETVLRALVFGGSPCVIPPNYPKYLDAVRFTLTKEGDKDVLRVEYDFVGEDEIYATLADDIRAQVSELMALLSDTRATYILVPLTHEDMMKHLESKFDKIMLAFPGKPPPWVRPDAVQEARARQAAHAIRVDTADAN